jgi:hypothetical protein
VKQKKFCEVSIITALNVHKDEINNLGTLRFSQETNQQLIDFFSKDSISLREEKKARKFPHAACCEVPTISDEIQNVLWERIHSANTKNIPGKLSLCIGMPVIIRNNSATELCITKGQEGWFIVGNHLQAHKVNESWTLYL